MRVLEGILNLVYRIIYLFLFCVIIGNSQIICIKQIDVKAATIISIRFLEFFNVLLINQNNVLLCLKNWQIALKCVCIATKAGTHSPSPANFQISVNENSKIAIQ